MSPSDDTPENISDDIYDPGFVKDVFDRCSERYIAFSYFCSLGFTERWRRQCVGAMPAPDDQAPEGYDLMAGTGEVWPHLLKRFPGTRAITAVDISSGMHRRALERLHAHRAHKIDFIEDDVLASALPDESAAFVISTFGLKTFNPAQHARLARLVARALKPGGVFSMIEASDPKGWLLRPLYLFHLKTILPLVERVLLRGAQDFAMIGIYSTNFGDASAFSEMLRSEGLEVEFKRYFFGCATGVVGRKPGGIEVHTTRGRSS
ncbi:class I SAM-dependent methyltransferase [Pelagibius litoralis]|uniref:Class I SAM-dependent methyltransferase n=1 Tax=Pelagibius litoralis TaxID=374515 RepID=A0A967EVQ8_9PROT|nr:class I SAM-dependent methyltransferase [Pelagibius litoralis]NIA68194.1 class I SAM-dependent methyltransferase [Pelagibius litoralis]